MGDLKYNQHLPQNFKRFPSQLPCNRVGIEDVVAVGTDGVEYPIFDPINQLNEFNFLKVLKYYGGVSGGVGLNPNTPTDLFHIENDKGGFIPIIVFPAITKGTECIININIDNKITEIEIPPNSDGEWRAVLGGFFPLDRRASKDKTSDEHAKIRFLERRTVSITNPVSELEMGNIGLYFEKFISITFLGTPIEEKHGTYTCFSLVKFT